MNRFESFMFRLGKKLGRAIWAVSESLVLISTKRYCVTLKPIGCHYLFATRREAGIAATELGSAMVAGRLPSVREVLLRDRYAMRDLLVLKFQAKSPCPSDASPSPATEVSAP